MNKNDQKPLSILLSLIMVFSLFSIVPITADAAERIYYLSRSRDAENSKVIDSEEWIDDYYVLETTNDTFWAVNDSCSIVGETYAANGWYVVTRTVSIFKSFVVQGDKITETGTSRSAMMVSPSGFSISISEHIKK